MTNSYVLVNPYIQGDFKTEIKAENSKVAAKIFYKNLSEHFNNAVPKFFFTIQKGGSGKGKYYHFQSKEKRNKDEVSFTISPYTANGNMDSFKNKLTSFKNKITQAGGKDKKHKKSRDSSDSSDSDSSDSENYIKNVSTYPLVNQPIYYWWYDPYVYKLESLFIPTFYAYVTPIIEIGF